MNEITNGAAAVNSEDGNRLLPRKKSKAPLIAVGAVLALAVMGYGALCVLAHTSTTFFPSTVIEGVDVGGLGAQDAAEIVCAQLLDREFTLESQDGERFTFTPASIGAATEESVTAAVSGAYSHQHGENVFLGGLTYLKCLLGRGASPALVWNRTAIDSAAAEMKKNMDRAPLDASYEISESGLRVTVARHGRSVDSAALSELLVNMVSLPMGTMDARPLGETVIPAGTLTAQALHDEIAGEVKNAGYDAATGTITPEQLGADFDVAAVQKLLDAAAPGSTVTIPAVIEVPEVTAAELKEVLFRDILGECKTHVTGTAARKTNIRLAAEKINGFVMNTGDVFSYNGVVGQRTAEAGFRPAPAYVRGETVDEIGGGICQVSSTLYLACLRGNLTITERFAHRYVPAYIDWGMDATVSWGGPDYKFTNDTLYPIRIETVYEKEYLTVRVYGTNVDGSYVRMTNETLSKTDWTTEYVEDESIPSGTEQVKTTPYTGYQVKTYRHVYDRNGRLISSAYEATSNYKVRNKVILRAPGELPGAKVPTVAPVAPEIPVETPDPVPQIPDVPAVPETPEQPVQTPAPAPEPPAETETPVAETPENPDEQAPTGEETAE